MLIHIFVPAQSNLPLYLFSSMQIKPLSEDNFSGLTLSKEYLEKQQSSSNYVSPLLEKTLLLLPPCFLYFQGGKPDTHGFVHVLDFLFQSKFEVCGMKMVQLSSKKAQELKLLLSLDIEVNTPPPPPPINTTRQWSLILLNPKPH